jgi:hypothetical protein
MQLLTRWSLADEVDLPAFQEGVLQYFEDLIDSAALVGRHSNLASFFPNAQEKAIKLRCSCKASGC